MTVELNHTIVWCTDADRSAAFLVEMLGRPAPRRFLHFRVVELDNGVSMDFMEKEGEVARQHYAFLVAEADFDALLGRIQDKGLSHWADPARTKPKEINRHWDGRAASISRIPTATCSRRSPGPMAARTSSSLPRPA